MIIAWDNHVRMYKFLAQNKMQLWLFAIQSVYSKVGMLAAKFPQGDQLIWQGVRSQFLNDFEWKCFWQN